MRCSHPTWRYAIMFGWKKKKQATASPSDSTHANGKPENNTKKRKGSGTLSGHLSGSLNQLSSKLFGSQSDGINKAGVGKQPNQNKPPVLKSPKKKQAPPPPKPYAPQIVVTDDERDGRSNNDNSFRTSTPSGRAAYETVNDSQFSNISYHNGSIGNHTLQKSGSSVSSASNTHSASSVDGEEEEDVGAGREYTLRPIVEWGEDDVLEWLEDIGLEYFVDMFQGKFLRTFTGVKNSHKFQGPLEPLVLKKLRA